MSYRYERYSDRPRRSPLRGWIVGLTILIWIILLGLLALRFVVRPMLSNMVQQRVAERSQVTPDNSQQAPDVGNIQLPVAITPGSFTIREDDANNWIATHPDQLKGVDGVRLHFVPGEVQADVTAAGFTSTARAGLQVQDGRLVVTNPRLDLPLSAVLDPQSVANAIQTSLNNDLAASGRKMTGVSVDQGQIVVTVE